MRTLITGGAGFIGSHLAEALIARGDHVCVVDDLSTGALANLAAIPAHRRFAIVRGSCADPAIMTELVARHDRIFHLAAVVGVQLVIDAPVRTIETNVRTSDTVLSLAARSRTPVLLASTSEVYGKNARPPFREDADLVLGPPTQGRWSYACVKALAELHALAYWHEQRAPVVVARLFNTVGPRQVGHYGMVVPTFVRQGLAGEPITIFGDGEQSRCFSHVRDVVEALVALLDGPRHVGEIYNVGSTHETRIVELAHQVRALTGARSPIVFAPAQAVELGRRVPDVTKIERAIGWTARIELAQILADVIAYAQGHR